MKKKRLTLALVLVCALLLGIAGTVYATGYTYGQYNMTYLPGTTDTVTNMPANETGLTPGSDNPYTVSSTVPVREGFEFIDWELTWGTMDMPAVYTLTYHVVGDDTYGVPSDSATPEMVENIPDGGSVDPLAAVPVTSWTTSDGTADGIPGIWSFSEYWTEDAAAPGKADLTDNKIEGITEDKDVYGAWTFTPDTYEVTYVVNDDPTYGAPEDSVTPTDENSPYEYMAQVTVKDNLTTAQTYAVVDGKQVRGKWTFTPWDKEDFQITEDTTITGSWDFTPYTYYTVHYLDKETNKPVAPDKVVGLDGEGNPTLEVESTFIERAIDVDGYEKLDPTLQAIVLDKSDNEITFWYERKTVTLTYVVSFQSYSDLYQQFRPDGLTEWTIEVPYGSDVTLESHPTQRNYRTAVGLDGVEVSFPSTVGTIYPRNVDISSFQSIIIENYMPNGLTEVIGYYVLDDEYPGWNESADLNGDVITSIKNMTEDKTVYGLWIVKIATAYIVLD